MSRTLSVAKNISCPITKYFLRLMKRIYVQNPCSRVHKALHALFNITEGTTAHISVLKFLNATLKLQVYDFEVSSLLGQLHVVG